MQASQGPRVLSSEERPRVMICWMGVEAGTARSFWGEERRSWMFLVRDCISEATMVAGLRVKEGADPATSLEAWVRVSRHVALL